jgi:tetratricopeptide (TPR) repeat protein
MSKEEIGMLEKCVGEYILMNSFLSTSLNRQRARSFLFSADTSDDGEQVFFKIDADPRLDNIKPFRNITSSSYFPDEKEVLFMVGTIFRLVQMKRDSDGIWNIRMMLCSENDHQLQSLFQHMKNERGAGETDLLQFGHVLRNMGKLNDAEKYYRRYLDQLSADHPDISSCYHALGSVANDKGNYDSSLKWYNKSLEIDMRTLKSDHPDIASTHCGIANVHQKKGDYALALESYEKALMICKKAHGEDHPLVAGCLNNMGNVYQNEKKYSKALEFYRKALTIRQKHLPADHSDLGASHNDIGVIHDCLGHYDQALEHYNSSLRIKSKSVPPQHPSIAMTLENIGRIYEQKRDFQQALSYFDKAAKIYRHSLSSTHPSVIKIDQAIKRVSSKLK